MQTFITGGTGLIGSAVVAELLGHGHTVLARARSDTSAGAVEGAGAEAVPGRLVETDPLPTGGPVGGRGKAVNAVLALAARGVRSTAVRLPRTVHNDGRGGFAGILTGIARRTGVSGYPGDGT